MPDSSKCLRVPVRKNREMDWQLVASYFTVKSTDIFCSVPGTVGQSDIVNEIILFIGHCYLHFMFQLF